MSTIDTLLSYLKSNDIEGWEKEYNNSYQGKSDSNQLALMLKESIKANNLSFIDSFIQKGL